ncbi:SagB family peptide dehydrogenase [Streptomyces cadmiisoli]|uniref:SagB family peptide dehydrogenase n=1 Tax=Streptomyces cadmiisoli TaxID=2184053 RepID=UPI00364D969F
MSAAGPLTAERYWDLTVEALPRDPSVVWPDGQGEEGRADQPSAFTLRPGLVRHRLPGPDGSLGDTRAALAGADAAQAQSAVPGRPPLQTLSNLLRYGYGVVRQELGPDVDWPYRRAVASARCLYPTELYVWGPAVEGLPSGPHHYDPAHHMLAQLGSELTARDLSVAAGTDVRDAQAVVLLTARYWRTAFKYRDYAYRLCTQETGIVTANLLQTAQALGLRAEVRYRLRTAELRDALGLVPDQETPMALIALYDDRLRNGRRPPAPAAEGEQAPNLMPGPRRDQERRTAGTQGQGGPRQGTMRVAAPPAPVGAELNEELCPRLVEMDRAAVRSPVVPVTAAAHGAAPLEQPVAHPSNALRLPQDEGPWPDLAEVASVRSSGPYSYRPTGLPVEAATVGRLMAYLLRPYRSDLSGDDQPAVPDIDCYVLANRVTGIPQGAYRLLPGGDALAAIATDSVSTALRTTLPSGQEVNLAAAALVCYLVGDRRNMFSRYGENGFRLLSHEAGLVAHRLSTAGAAAGLTVRTVNAFAPDAVRSLLRLDGPRRDPVFQIAVAACPPGRSYSMKVTF